ncbi:hypothetical protein LJC57_10495 [Parabacteroides sp. OttesenSCG-928-G07]|nr:hypothetical protein [Parabacteroides sp. OttesenSCG-928-G07]
MKKNVYLSFITFLIVSSNILYAQDPYITGPSSVIQYTDATFTVENASYIGSVFNGYSGGSSSEITNPFEINGNQIRMAFTLPGIYNFCLHVRKENTTQFFLITKQVNVTANNNLSLTISNPRPYPYNVVYPEGNRFRVVSTYPISDLYDYYQYAVGEYYEIISIVNGDILQYDYRDAGKFAKVVCFVRRGMLFAARIEYPMILPPAPSNVYSEIGYVVIELEDIPNKTYSLLRDRYEIINAFTGKMVLNGILESGINQINTYDIPNSTYIVRIIRGDNVESIKINIKK